LSDVNNITGNKVISLPKEQFRNEKQTIEVRSNILAIVEMLNLFLD